jgi:DNA-binding LacI/PurR family transcriptional regulator
LIVFGVYFYELGMLFERYQMPWVSLFPRLPVPAKAVVADDPDMPKYQLTHLWSLGHKRIGYLDHVDLRAPNLMFIFRRESYYRLMAEKGLKVEPHWVVPVGMTEKETIASFELMFSKEPHPTAIIVGDSQISTACRFLESRGLNVPGDVSIIGTDDIPVTATLHPAGTTIHNPRDKAISMALECLDGLLMGRPVPQQQYVPLRLVVRESTGPVREEK